MYKVFKEIHTRQQDFPTEKWPITAPKNNFKFQKAFPHSRYVSNLFEFKYSYYIARYLPRSFRQTVFHHHYLTDLSKSRKYTIEFL